MKSLLWVLHKKQKNKQTKKNFDQPQNCSLNLMNRAKIPTKPVFEHLDDS